MLSINYLTFHQEVMLADMPVLLFCSEHLNPISDQVRPVVDKLEEVFGDRIKFTKLRIEDFPNLAERLNAKPGELILFGKGKELDRFMGLEPEFLMHEKINDAYDRMHMMNSP